VGISVGPWWERSGSLYIRSFRTPSHVVVNGVEVAAKQGAILTEGEALEKPVLVRFGNYEMTFEA
jgi:hypothetical protein